MKKYFSFAMALVAMLAMVSASSGECKQWL